MKKTSSFLVFTTVVVAAGLVMPLFQPAISQAAESGSVLTGTIKSASGEKMEGVTVSARAEGKTITTSVFTDKEANYYFPPMEDGKYRLWAQAIGYGAGRGEVELRGAVQHKDFVMKETKDFVNQLPGGEYVAALPLDTPEHRRGRDIFVKNCIICHTAALALQSRFDEKGWEAIVNMMSRITALGTMRPTSTPPSLFIEHFKKELVAYLTEMRGPGPSPMHFRVPPRSTGAATLPVVYEYDIPLEEYGGYTVNDGSDWSFGTPSNSWGVRGVHDASIDFQGNIWFTYFVPTINRAYGKIDTKTGEVTNFKIPGRNGMDGGTHSSKRGPDGSIWFSVNAGTGSGSSGNGEGFPGSIGRVDPKTGKMEIFTPPKGMAGVDLFVDVDGKGFVWGSTPTGAVRLDPKTGEFKEFKSLTQVPGNSYGIAGDRLGNAWWAEIAVDKIGYSDIETGESREFNIPRGKYVSEGALTPEDLKFFEETTGSSQGGAPWKQGPRRLSADKNGDYVWAGLWVGSNVLGINIHTLEYKIYPLPGNGLGAYMPVVDNSHNVWVTVQGNDEVSKLDPKTGEWTQYIWPTRGAAPRHISLLERNGVIQIVTAFWGTSKAARMVIRTEKDLQALKTQVQSVASGR